MFTSVRDEEPADYTSVLRARVCDVFLNGCFSVVPEIDLNHANEEPILDVMGLESGGIVGKLAGSW